MKTLFIYMYAAFLVIKSLPALRKVQKIPDHVPTVDKNERVFHIPSLVSRKVTEKTGSKVIVKGNEKLPEGPVLYVANHQGLFDILGLLGYAGKPLGFIAKKEINKIPIIRKWMKEIDCVFIDRANRREAVKVMNQGIENLKNGQSMVIFPEGTRSRGTAVSEFKSGSLRLGTKANVPIVPIAIDGTYKVMEQNDGKIKPTTIYLEICDPIYPDEYKDKKHNELIKEIENAVVHALKGNQEKVS